MEVSKTPVSGGFYSNKSFINTKTSLILSLFDYFSNLFFDGDSNRVIYASNDFSFRKRMSQNKKDIDNENILIQNLNLPYMNFYMTDLQPTTERTWKSFPLELQGVMDWTIRKKLRISPVKISFEATLFTEKETDRHYIMSEAFWQGALERKLNPLLEIDGQSFSNIGVLKFGLNFSDQYQEKDWLEKNRIRATSIDFEVDTFLIKTNTEGFCIPKEVLLSFATTHDLSTHDWDDYDLLYQAVIDHINHETVF
jgi:hypothetical protein